MPRLWKAAVHDHKQEVTRSILDAAESLASKGGIRSVTMSRIAETAGIGRATLYKYFPDLEAVLATWHERHVAKCLARFAEFRDSPEALSKRLWAVLHHYAMVQYGARATDISVLLHKQDYVQHAQREMLDLIKGLLAEGVRRVKFGVISIPMKRRSIASSH